MKVIRPTFFAVQGGSDTDRTYSRYIVVSGGVAGFTVAWNTKAFPNGSRVAIVMANELYPRHMVSDAGQQADILESFPSDAAPNAPSAPVPADGLAFSGDTPTNAGSDVVSQAALEAKLEAQRKAEQERADQLAQQRAAQQEEADRRAAAADAARAAAEERIKIAQQEEADRQAKAEAERLVQRAEADRKAKAEQDARDEAAAQLRADRLARATAAAKQAIADASGFVKSDRGDPQLVDHLGRIADLNVVLSNAEPEIVEGKTSALMKALAADPAYGVYEAQRAAEQTRETARYLGDALRALKNQKAFLIGAVAQNPTSPQAGRLLSLAKQADAALAAPDLEQAQTLMGTVDSAIKEAGLHDAFVTASAAATKAAATKAADAEAVAASTAANPAGAGAPEAVAVPAASFNTGAPSAGEVTRLPVTEKNRFLLDGERDDVVLMVNASPKAPHAYRDLKGDLVFDHDEADVCLFGRADPALAGVVRSALAKYKLKQLSLAPAPCDGDRLGSYDVVATRRGIFLRQEAPVASQLIEAVEADTLKPLTTVTPAVLQAAAAAESVAGEAVAEDVARGTRQGFGVLEVTEGVPGLCAVVPENAEAHQRLIADKVDVLTAALGTAPVMAPTTIDGAFVSIKRGQCGAVYASAADLKALADGLRRDGTNYRFSSLWITPAALQTAEDAIKAKQAAAEKQETERQTRQVEDARIAALRAADEAATLSARQAASRSQYGATATAAAARIAAEVDDFTDAPADQGQVAAQKFPGFAAQFREDLGERWEKMSENSELSDYGTADWKERTLDAAFTRVTIRFKSPDRGDYKSRCYIFGQINDPEFDVTREHVVVPCDDGADLESWKRRMDSRVYGP